MKSALDPKTVKPSVTLILGLLLLMPATAMAASGDWRPLYDTIMRWINFGIMVALFLKYAKAPLADFIRAKRGEVAAEMKHFEKEKKAALDKVSESEAALAKSQERLETIHQRIVAQGEQRKQQIIADAQRESEIIIQAAQSKIEADIRQARTQLRDEMVERAVDLAQQRLPAEVSASDNQKWVDRFINATLAV